MPSLLQYTLWQDNSHENPDCIICIIPTSHVVPVGCSGPTLASQSTKIWSGNTIVPPSSARDSLGRHNTLLAAMTQVQSERMT